MFVGIAFMLQGNMCCSVTNDARPMDFTGRPMKGCVFVDAAALGDRDLKRWA